MVTRKQQQRLAMFSRGTEAVERVLVARFPDVQGKYVCPVCLLAFPEEAVTERPPVLTLEHAPSKASGLGGSAVALTCVECNGRAHRSEAHLAEYLKKLAFLRTRRLRRRRIILSKGGVSIRGLIEIDGAQARMEIPKNQNDPAEIRRFNEAKADRADRQWSVPFDFDDQEVELAFLKAAYIGAFARFGYTYLFGVRALRAVRAELMEPSGSLRGFVGRWSDVSEASLRFVIYDKPVPTLMVEIGVHTVVLPWVGSAGDYYKTLGRISKKSGSQQFGSALGFAEWPSGLMLSGDFDREPLSVEAWAEDTKPS